jgi:hypothetical protein
MSPGAPAGLERSLRLVSPIRSREGFRLSSPRWLDVAFGPMSAWDNVRIHLLAAGVPADSCPRGDIRRLVLATWWVRVEYPRCACSSDALMDVLVVRRHGGYRVFGVA